LEEAVVNSPSILYYVMLKIWIGYPAIHNSYSLSNLCIFTWSKLIATRITFQFRIDYHLMVHIPFLFKMRTSPTLFKNYRYDREVGGLPVQQLYGEFYLDVRQIGYNAPSTLRKSTRATCRKC
jgi:hypothetical protein